MGEKEAPMKIDDIMTENPVCCTPETDLEDVARMMVENDCGAIPVVEDQESWKPVGIITDRDITVRTVAEGKNPLDLKASDCMTPSVVTVKLGSSLQECLDTMEEHQLRRILVVDAEGACCGIVAQADIARHASKEDTAEIVEEVSQPAPGTP